MNKRARVAQLAVAALGLGLLAPTLATASSGPVHLDAVSVQRDKITAKLEQRFDRDATQDFWVRFTERADTSAAREIDDWAERGWYVYDALTETAEKSQASVRELLDERDVAYESYWIVNAIKIEDGSEQLAEELAAYSTVQRLLAPTTYSLPKPIDAQPRAEVNSVEWGVANINADDVWSQYGVTGEGITVAGIDTGTQYDHPALVRQYRGNNGDGTFDHNYNWYDAANSCDDGPCDKNGHGTHTMGTMVGDDGAGNQVGVAPGAQWIEANGCCPTDAALVASGEWLLAPRDLTDAAETADPAKRPHIINNSWGTNVPTNDPFMPQVVQAWADAGIFGVFSNGNEGPGCETSGSPGSRTATYSVGAYDSNNQIASFSARGPGQDGTVKPNIAAPGVNVRSTWLGGTYNAISGTSMAAPHVAGAVALLWSAYPELIGDVDATRRLLDLTAINTFDGQCGGDAEDNNVYGEGRLDALALIQAGAVGTSQLVGHITDEAGQPAAGVRVTAEGPLARSTRTAADGSYSLRLLAGSYDVTVVGGFGYEDDVQTVQVDRDAVVTHDVSLTPTPRVAVTGVVRDGSGQGWPLAATVVLTHESGFEQDGLADPATGGYQVEVVPDATYTMRVSAEAPGYEPYEAEVTVGPDGLVRDVALTVSFACTAPGYEVAYDGVREAFDGRTAWRVTNVDHDYPGYDDRPGWLFSNPGGRPNATGGSGEFAIVDSDYLGQHHVQDTYLTSPVIDMSGRADAALEFGNDLVPAVNSTASVDLSVDGGQTWSTVWHRRGFAGAVEQGPYAIALPTAVDAGAVRVRFHYTGQWSGWWAIDDVFLGDRTCTPAG